MAAVTIKWYGKVTLAMLNKEHDWLDDTYKIMFSSATHTPDQDVHDYKDDVTNEVTGTNLPAGGLTLANKTIGYTGATNVTKLDCDDPTAATVTAAGIKNVHIYNSTPATDATRPLLGFGVIDTAVSPDAGTFTIQLDTAGLLTTTPAA